MSSDNKRIVLSLLEEESPLLIKPKLAVMIGLNEAIILQQINYWINLAKKLNQNYREGYTWVYKTYKEWKIEFPFFSHNTIVRTIKSLENQGHIISANYNESADDHTKWYTIAIPKCPEAENPLLDGSLTQNEQTPYSKWVGALTQNGHISKEHRLHTKITHRNSLITACGDPNFSDLKFDEWWKLYPNKKGKQKAKAAFFNKMKAKSREQQEKLYNQILLGLNAHLEEKNIYNRIREQNPTWKIFYPEFPHGSTWMNGERWLDTYKNNYDEIYLEIKLRQSLTKEDISKLRKEISRKIILDENQKFLEDCKKREEKMLHFDADKSIGYQQFKKMIGRIQ